jgi:Fur family transcriptional regulator, peroxide stress response regulator
MAPHRDNMTGFAQAFRDAGLRLTHQRLEIYRELKGSTDHPTAEVLHHRLRERISTLSLDTVYRTLATLAAHGMVKRLETAESLARFDVTRHRHHHLICKRCNEIMDFQWQQLDDMPLPAEIVSWGRLDNTNVVVYGICSRCLESPDEPA